MRASIIWAVLVVSFIVICMACNRAPNYSVIPQISFLSISPATVHEIKDSFHVSFAFQDGDGDIGRDKSDTFSTHRDVFFTDNRVSDPTKPKNVTPFKIPNITPFGRIKAVSGVIRITVNGVNRRPGHITDTLTYSIQLRDRAGHLSNSVTTTPIVILP